MAVRQPGFGQVNLGQAAAQVEVVALRGQSAVDGAGADGDEYLAASAELMQYMHVFRVAHAAFDDADVARSAVLDVGDRRTVEFDEFKQCQQAFVDVQQRHMATETAGERSGSDA
jgi:hypothetical protein